MAGSSVTGKGPGSAEKAQKKPELLTRNQENLLGPRIIFASTTTLDNKGEAQLYFPLPNSSNTTYIAIATSHNIKKASPVSAVCSIGSTDMNVEIKGKPNEDVSIMIVKSGTAM